MAPLVPDLYHYLHSTLASSTFNTYRTAWNSYNSFCLSSHVPPLPLYQQILLFYVTFLARRLSYKSIKVYLSGIQFCSNFMGLTTNVSEMCQLFSVLRGIRRVQGSSCTRPRRPALTVTHLNQIIRYVFASPIYHPHDKIMLVSAITIAFFGLLRSSEYCVSSRLTYDPASVLLFSDISFTAHYKCLTIKIKSSKTDPSRVGCDIRIGYVGNNVCPVNRLLAFLNVHPSMEGPLFTFQDGSFLTRQAVADLLKLSLPNVRYVNSHSLRIGGASAAASAGVPDSTIQIMGRWSSNAYLLYLRLRDEDISSVTSRIATVSTITRYWDSESLASSDI